MLDHLLVRKVRSLLAIPELTAPRNGAELSIFVPALALLPGEMAFDLLQFPVLNINGYTHEVLRGLAPCSADGMFCAVYAADPFTDWQEMLAALKAAGFRGVTNFPTIAEFAGEEMRSLRKAGFSVETELTRLRWLHEEGLEVALCLNRGVELECGAALEGAISAIFVSTSVSSFENSADTTAIRRT